MAVAVRTVQISRIMHHYKLIRKNEFGGFSMITTAHAKFCGQSYKASTISIYEHGVVNICKLTSKFDSRVVIYTRRGFMRLANGDCRITRFRFICRILLNECCGHEGSM